MILTNRLGLPKAFELAVAADPYDKGKSDVTVTGLLNPPRQRVLVEAHKDEVTEDVSDRIWSLFGSAIHSILERAGADAGEEVEERLYTTIMGWIVGGKFDSLRLDEKKLTDYKTTSVWTRIYNSRMQEWTEQLNMLAALCRLNELAEVESLSIVALYRDWSDSKSQDGRGYPTSPVEEIPIECMSQSDAMDMMTGLVLKHQEAEIKLPECSPEERWFNKRTGKNQRCERYCQAAPWCEQWQELKRQKG